MCFLFKYHVCLLLVSMHFYPSKDWECSPSSDWSVIGVYQNILTFDQSEREFLVNVKSPKERELHFLILSDCWQNYRCIPFLTWFEFIWKVLTCFLFGFFGKKMLLFATEKQPNIGGNFEQTNHLFSIIQKPFFEKKKIL